MKFKFIPNFNFMRELIKILKPYIKRHVKFILLLAFITIITVGLSTIIPYFNGKVIDIILSTSQKKDLFIAVIILLGIYLGKYLSNLYLQNALLKLGAQIVNDIRGNMLKKALRLTVAYYDKHDMGYVISRTSECNSIMTLFSSSTVSLFSAILEFFGAVIISFTINKKLFFLIAAFLPVYVILVIFSSKNISRLTRRMLEVTANTSGKILQIVSSVIDVKLLNLYKKHGKAIKSILNKYFLATIKQGKSLICYSQNTQFISTILQLILLLVSGFMIIDGKITIGTYTAFGGYATKIVGSIQAFSSIIVLVTPIQSSAIRIYEFLGLDEENDNKQLFLEKRGIESIRFNNVSFSYGNKNVIKNFSYDIRRGDKILITGKNGVGKSTIIKLMLGFYDNYEGEIIINEKNLHHINLNNLRNNVAIVSQPCYFFYGSVMENIIYDGNKRKKEFLFYLQKKYHLHNYFQSLNHGYHTIIKNDISNLSAGQKQLIGFCRALCSQKNFMILDEATANMEKGLKYKILEMLFNETKNRTCLVISHDQELNEILKNRGFKELTIK
ncbi:MAG: ABC transporter ATP-binding protein [Clostridia bacterium]